MIFKNPLGIPGFPSSIPSQSQPVPPPRQFEGQYDFQLTSAGTNGPILAPKLPASAVSEQGPSQPAGGFSEKTESIDNTSYEQPNDLAQNAPAASSMYPPPISAEVYHYQQESSTYGQDNRPNYTFQGQDFRHGNEIWAAHGSPPATLTAQGVQV